MSSSTVAEMSAVLAAVADLESRLAALKSLLGQKEAAGAAAAPPAEKQRKQRKPRDPDAPKKEPNDWIKFSVRIRELLKTNEKSFKMAKHLIAFAKFLKDKTPMADWTDEGILAERETWVPPAAAESSESEGEEIKAAKEELRAVAMAAIAEGKSPDEAIEAHTRDVIAPRLAAAGGGDAESGSESEGKKRPGRPKMTAEEKAAAAAAREAKLAAMTPAEREAVAQKKAALKAKRAAVKGGAGGGAAASEAEE